MVTSFAAAQHDSVCASAASAPWLALSEGWVGSVHAVSRQVLYWPFDALRDQYATAVRAGLIERSLIASSQFERKTAALEQALLGSYARQV
ncbi:MAG: hypothetical protein J0I24_02130 [Thiomonas arsenitoxydans]|mgnify:FL=1|uniref:Uncharacterized protein n=1 Tax=Thiomonas arsenitoxydans (strain DSM 22701 / CIP 110005 / 3As) TaxID=426114 RepID=A0A8I1MTZ2_THIA3|nr:MULTISPECIES: hypothetical protein [Thiomonas]MBN8743084.1 hypothetical protein [Thiomonas arsenitoxydans]ODU98687.1 MAG: hypothetical protein ABT24_00480 [Thiomonas sp. SCN 64-16]